MIVGTGSTAKGEVDGCAKLVVEGVFEGTYEGGNLYVGPQGSYTGTAHVATAEVCGVFEGELTAGWRLTVTGTGRVNGKIRYHELQQSPEAVLTGDVKQYTNIDV